MMANSLCRLFPRTLLLAASLLAVAACSEPEARLALGTLERDRVTLAATAAELIVSQPVAEGAAVQPGDLLVQLDTTLQQTVLARLDADIAQQQARLDELRNGSRPEEITAAQARVASMEAALRETSRDLDRITTLVARGLGAQADKETLEARRDANAARLRDAEAQLQLLRAGTRAEDLAQAQAQLQSLQAQLAGEQQRLANLAIVATRAGTLDSLPWQVGERVAIGQQVAVLLADGPPYARVYIPEPKRAALVVGATLQVLVDGVDAPFAGTLRWISQEPAFTPYYALQSSERSRLVWLAEVQLPASAANLPAGLPAQVQLP
jgi:HlyD family secretion protein